MDARMPACGTEGGGGVVAKGWPVIGLDRVKVRQGTPGKMDKAVNAWEKLDARLASQT